MNNDLISREALTNVILNDSKLDGVNANWEVNRILVHIEKAPPIEPERQKGMWMYHTDGYTAFYTCNKCNDFGDIQDKFCKHCGADMKGSTAGGDI